jgi:tripartite-type tricarboxylate transporter receptor subunit TctC
MTAGTTYTYSARVVDAAGSQGTLGTTRAATYDATTRTAAISGAFNGVTLISAGTSTPDTTPEIRGTVNAALLGPQSVTVLRDARWSCARELSQLLSAGCAVAVQRRAARARSLIHGAMKNAGASAGVPFLIIF